MTSTSLPQYLLRHDPTKARTPVRDWCALVLNDKDDPLPEQVTVQEIHHYKLRVALRHEALCFKLQVGNQVVWIGVDRDASSHSSGASSDASRAVSQGISAVSSDVSTYITSARPEKNEPPRRIILTEVWTTMDHVWLSEGRSEQELLWDMALGDCELVGSTTFEASTSPPTVIDLAHALLSASLTMGPYNVTGANCYIYSASIRTILEQPKYQPAGPPDLENAGIFVTSTIYDARTIVAERYRTDLIAYHDDRIVKEPGAAVLAKRAAEADAKAAEADAKAAEANAKAAEANAKAVAADAKAATAHAKAVAANTKAAASDAKAAAADARAAEADARAAEADAKAAAAYAMAASLEAEKEQERARRLAAEARVAELENLSLGSGALPSGAGASAGSPPIARGRPSVESTSSRH